MPHSPFLELGLLTAGILSVIAIIVDLSMPQNTNPDFPPVTAELRDALLNPPTTRYVDAKGLFRVGCPSGWSRTDRPDSAPYDVVFFSPNRASISIMATRVKYNDLPSLFKDIERNEAEYGLRTEVETIRFNNKPAIKRTCVLNAVKIFSIDFVDNYVAHHILCRVPKNYDDKYVPVLMELLNTYEPLNPSDGDARREGDTPSPPNPGSTPPS
jgi:hypothetical protein